MRADDPVHYDRKLDMYLVSRYQDLQKVLQDPSTFSVKHGYSAQNAAGFQEEFQHIVETEGGGFFHDSIMTDPPEHTRIRRLLEKAFTAHRVKQLEPGIRQIAVEIIDSVADRGAADGVTEIASPLTIRVICKQLGLNDIDPRKISEWSLAATAQVGRMQNREEMLGHAKKYCEMQQSLIKHIRAREKKPTEDMISDLVHAQLEDEENPRLNFGEIVSLARTVLVGGNDTTATGISNLLLALATRPEIAEQLRASAENETMMTRFVEEFLRLEPPVHGLSRMTTKEVELGGKLLPKGAHLLLLYASGNDDENNFPSPRKFDTTRVNLARHLTFGNGIHRCIGLALARMEIKVAAQELARRLENFRLTIAVEEIRYFPTVATRNAMNLPLTFSRRR
jgi:cytochrome P450